MFGIDKRYLDSPVLYKVTKGPRKHPVMLVEQRQREADFITFNMYTISYSSRLFRSPCHCCFFIVY